MFPRPLCLSLSPSLSFLGQVPTPGPAGRREVLGLAAGPWVARCLHSRSVCAQEPGAGRCPWGAKRPASRSPERAPAPFSSQGPARPLWLWGKAPGSAMKITLSPPALPPRGGLIDSGPVRKGGWDILAGGDSSTRVVRRPSARLGACYLPPGQGPQPPAPSELGGLPAGSPSAGEASPW